MDESEVIGFVGTHDKKVEMLFLSPAYIGRGLGKELMTFAVKDLKADKVDVNEDNKRAVNFYRRFGFDVYERTSTDDQGRNYPLLRMKLA